MKRLLFLCLLLLARTALAQVAPCSSNPSFGTLGLVCTMPRTTGIAPLLVFVDCTGTTSNVALPGGNNTTQDVYYQYSFGDPGVSGTGTWAAGSNPGNNSTNSASGGPVAAHLYVLPTAGTTDTTYTLQVWAWDGANTGTCTLSATAYAPSGSNGFNGNKTTCYFNATVGTGCPSGATQTTSSTIHLPTNGKRTLYKCGDSFTGSPSFPATTQTVSVGAYGGCENTASNRPIFSGSQLAITGVNTALATPADIRIADVDFEQTACCSGTALTNNNGGEETQITLYNLNCNDYAQCWLLASDTQSGLVASTMQNMTQTQGVYFNYVANQCTATSPGGLGSGSLFCGAASYIVSNYFPVEYNALLGNNLNGAGSPHSSGVGYETFRISACRMCVFSNNTFQNANDVGAVFKNNSANNVGGGSTATWIGQYSEYMEISDNLFTGDSGTVIAGVATENQTYDERLRYNVIERNIVIGTTACGSTKCGATKFLVGSDHTTIRNNITYTFTADTGSVLPSDYDWQLSRVAIEPVPQANEVYNNTCYALTTKSGCIGIISGDGTTGPGIGGSWMYNNMFYNNGATTKAAVTDNGTGNTVSNNTAASGAGTNPTFTNGSGNLNLVTDYKPTVSATYTGAASPPTISNYFDACGFSWSTAYTLGAVSQICP